jgi:pimeloyl-ACP methyl ester carboxylesterase
VNAKYLYRLVLAMVICSNLAAIAQDSIPSAYIQRDPARKDVIVFVHGVTGDAKETWTNTDNKAYWPELIRSDERFASANVWVFSYVSPKISNAQDVEELALKLGDALSEVLRTHERLYFLAHSMGGLIVREMLVLKALPSSKVPLIYFFGTPSAGADLAGLVAAISRNPQFENLRPFARESDVARFARSWLATSQDPYKRYPQKIWSYCSYELEGLVANKLIVPMLSASHLCSTPPRASLANHSTMVKPKDRTSEPYEYFASAYEFASSPVAIIMAENGAIKVHDQSSPGIDLASLKVRFASVSDKDFEVVCGESRAGVVKVNLDTSRNEKVIAAAKVSEDIRGMRASNFEPTVDAAGSLLINYSVTGVRPGFFGRCPTNGRASIKIQYVVEERQ